MDKKVRFSNQQKISVRRELYIYAHTALALRATNTPSIKAFIRGGSFDLINPSILWEQKINKNISSSLNAEYVNASGKYKFRYRKALANGQTAWDTTAVRQNGDIRVLRLEGDFNGYLDRGKWNIKAYFYDSEKNIPGAIVNNV